MGTTMPGCRGPPELHPPNQNSCHRSILLECESSVNEVNFTFAINKVDSTAHDMVQWRYMSMNNWVRPTWHCSACPVVWCAAFSQICFLIKKDDSSFYCMFISCAFWLPGQPNSYLSCICFLAEESWFWFLQRSDCVLADIFLDKGCWFIFLFHVYLSGILFYRDNLILIYITSFFPADESWFRFIKRSDWDTHNGRHPRRSYWGGKRQTMRATVADNTPAPPPPPADCRSCKPRATPTPKPTVVPTPTQEKWWSSGDVLWSVV